MRRKGSIMFFLVLKVFAKLVHFDFYLARRNFTALYDKVRSSTIKNQAPPADAVQRICLAVDLACIWYWKEVLCLQRAAVTACLLKRSGVPAQMIIGTQQLPFKAHAWVEVDGAVVNDKPYTRQIYTVLDRC